MKKLYCALSLSLVLGLAANAANPTADSMKRLVPLKSVPTTETVRTQTASINDNTSGKRMAKKKVSANDFYGDWQWAGQNVLSEVLMPNEGVMTISPIAGSDSILIKGLDQYADYSKGGLRGVFRDNRLYIPNQITLYDNTILGDQPVEPHKFMNWTLRGMTPEERDSFMNDPENEGEDPDNYGMLVHAPKGYDFFFLMEANGTLSCNTPATTVPEDGLYSATWSCASDFSIDEQYVSWFCAHIKAERIEPFEFNPDEWVEIGLGTYKDPWMAPLFEAQGEDVPDYEVPVWRSTLWDRRYLLQDPYGPDTPWGLVNCSDAEGYIVLDARNFDIVLAMPFVYSMSMDMGDEDESDVQAMYFYNQEAYQHVIQGNSLNKILNLMLEDGEDVSYVDPAKNTIHIYNPIFDMIPMGTFASPRQWTVNILKEGYIVLPEEWDAVETIIDENNQAPATYYNLQGVKVQNPQAGQILIVKKGNKAMKQIMR